MGFPSDFGSCPTEGMVNYHARPGNRNEPCFLRFAGLTDAGQFPMCEELDSVRQGMISDLSRACLRERMVEKEKGSERRKSIMIR